MKQLKMGNNGWKQVVDGKGKCKKSQWIMHDEIFRMDLWNINLICVYATENYVYIGECI